MTVSFQPVKLDADSPDTDAMLVFRDGRLLAVMSCLGDIHGELAGQWFVEVSFADAPLRQRTHATLASFESWLASPA